MDINITIEYVYKLKLIKILKATLWFKSKTNILYKL